MLKHNKQNKKLNNKGMTLIEIIITITILTMVSGFILSAFVSAMRTSAKSRDVHRATTVAQNIMEGINLKTAEELAYQFNYPITSDGTNNVDNFFVYPSVMFEHNMNLSVGELFEWTDPISGDVTTEVAGTFRSLNEYKALTNAYEIASTASAYTGDITSNEYDFLKDADGKYIYYMRNIENDGRYYNAKITLDAAPYKSGGSTGQTYNDDLLISVPTIDSTYDAVEVMDKNADSKGKTELEMANPGVTINDNDLCRLIEITIDNDLMAGPTTKYRTSVKVDYYYYTKDAYGNESDKVPLGTTNTVFDNVGNENDKQLRDIYLYYYPLYNSTFTGCKDFVTVKNYDNMDVELYVIKQEPATAITYTMLESKENSYNVTFEVYESTNNLEGKSHIALRTNWDENIASIHTHTAFLPTQATFRRNGSPTTKAMYNTTNIKNKQAHDRIYDVRVDIYSSEKMDDTTFASTALADWFKDENYLMTITSSISQ